MILHLDDNMLSTLCLHLTLTQTVAFLHFYVKTAHINNSQGKLLAVLLQWKFHLSYFFRCVCICVQDGKRYSTSTVHTTANTSFLGSLQSVAARLAISSSARQNTLSSIMQFLFPVSFYAHVYADCWSVQFNRTH